MSEKECPYRFGLPKKQRGCIGHECVFFTHLQGKNPQTHQVIDEFNCAIAWLPLMLVENSQRQMQTGASVDKVANEISKASQLMSLAMQRADLKAKGRLLQGDAGNKHQIDLKENGHGI